MPEPTLADPSLAIFPARVTCRASISYRIIEQHQHSQHPGCWAGSSSAWAKRLLTSYLFLTTPSAFGSSNGCGVVHLVTLSIIVVKV